MSSNTPPSVPPPPGTRSTGHPPPPAQGSIGTSSVAVQPPPPVVPVQVPAAAAVAKPAGVSDNLAALIAPLPSPLPLQPPHPDPTVEALICQYFPARADAHHPWAAYGNTMRYLLAYYEFVDLRHVASVLSSEQRSAKLLMSSILVHICKNRDFTVAMETVKELLAEAKTIYGRKRSVTEIDEDTIVASGSKRAAISSPEHDKDAGTPQYAPRSEG